MRTTTPKVRYLPPPVRLETREAGLALVAPAALWCLGVVALLWSLPQRPDALAFAVGAVVLTTWAAYREARPRTPVTLDWSTQGWHCAAGMGATQREPAPCVPIVLLDLQRLLLLRVQGLPGGVRWVWCQRRDANQWHRFRCALFAGSQT